MELGHLVPFGDIGGDPDTVRDYAQGLEALGYDFIEAPDHVLGANVASRPNWAGGNTSEDLFHDPFVSAELSRRHYRSSAFPPAC